MIVFASKIESHIYRIYESIADVNPMDWQRVTGNATDLGMDPRLIRVLEETLADQCRNVDHDSRGSYGSGPGA